MIVKMVRFTSTRGFTDVSRSEVIFQKAKSNGVYNYRAKQMIIRIDPPICPNGLCLKGINQHFPSGARVPSSSPPLNDARFVKEQWVRVNDDATRATTTMRTRGDSAVYYVSFDRTRAAVRRVDLRGSRRMDGVVRDRGFAVACGGIRGRRCARPRRAEDDDG
jgi:hypothetical protein